MDQALLSHHSTCTLFIKSNRQRNLSTFWLLSILKLAILLHFCIRYNGERRQLGNINWPSGCGMFYIYSACRVFFVTDRYVRILSTQKWPLMQNISQIPGRKNTLTGILEVNWVLHSKVFSSEIRIFTSKDFLTILKIPLVVA